METTIRCPACGRRLFDLVLSRPPDGALRIKCPRCKRLEIIDLLAYSEVKQARSCPASTASEPHLKRHSGAHP